MATEALNYELTACGVQDATLVSAILEDSVITLWRFTHMKTTAFAIQPQNFQASQGQAIFGGSNVRFPFPRAADLAYATFAVVSIPAIVGLDTSGDSHTVLKGLTKEPYWTNAIGQYVLKKIQFQIGSTVIDTVLNYQMYMWEELSGKPGKRLSEMIGKFDTVAMRQAQSRRSRLLYVPIPFYYTENTGLAVPLVSLQFHSIEFVCDFANLADCIVKPADFPTTNADVYLRTEGALDSEIEANSITSKAANSDLGVTFEIFGVWLDNDERSKFAHGQFEQITTEWQTNETQKQETVTSATESSSPVTHEVRLIFNHVVVEYAWAVRRAAAETANEWFNFGGHVDAGVTGRPLDPVKKAKITFNTNPRVEEHEGRFFRLVTPYVFHTSIPREFIYMWSFAVEPEDAQPSGGVNHSRLDNVYLSLQLDRRIFLNSSYATVLVAARSRNMLRYKQGLLARRFAA